jgi:hypothetical protein
MITKGNELYSFITLLNAEATVDATLADILVDNARAILEEERPWMALRATDPSIAITSSNTWETPHSISGIERFSRFYGETPIRLFDGSRIQYFTQVPFDRRLEYRTASGTFCYDVANGIIYLNGTVALSGDLYINHIKTSVPVDLSLDAAVWTPFPSRFLPLLGYYAIGIYKGAVDYDSINREMLPENRAALQALKNGLEKWDNELQMSEITHNDPSELSTEWNNRGLDTSS